MGSLHILKQGPGETTQVVQRMAGRTWCQYLLPPGVKEGAITSYKGTDDRWARSLPRKPAERHAPHSPFGENNHQLRPGWRKISHVSGVEAKQDLVGQGMHWEQENIHLGGSDRHSTPRHPAQPVQSWSTPFPRHPLGQVCRRQLQADTTKTVERGHPWFPQTQSHPHGEEWVWLKEKPYWWEFPGSPVIRTLHFSCRGHGFSTSLPLHAMLSDIRGGPIRSFQRKKKELIPLVGLVCPELSLFFFTQYSPGGLLGSQLHSNVYWWVLLTYWHMGPEDDGSFPPIVSSPHVVTWARSVFHGSPEKMTTAPHCTPSN